MTNFEEEEQDRPGFEGQNQVSFIDGKMRKYFSSEERKRRSVFLLATDAFGCDFTQPLFNLQVILFLFSHLVDGFAGYCLRCLHFRDEGGCS